MHSKENVSVFPYFITSTWAQKAKLTVNFLGFLLVKFRKIWQIGSKYFTLVGAHFSGNSIKPDFFVAVKDKNLKMSKKTALTNPTFLCLKFISHHIQCTAKIWENFTEGNSRKSQIKP